MSVMHFAGVLKRPARGFFHRRFARFLVNMGHERVHVCLGWKRPIFTAGNKQHLVDNERAVGFFVFRRFQPQNSVHGCRVIDYGPFVEAGAIRLDGEHRTEYMMVEYPKGKPFAYEIPVVVLGTSVVCGKKRARLIGELRYLAGVPAALAAALAFETGFAGNHEMAFGENAEKRGIGLVDSDVFESLSPLRSGQVVIRFEWFPRVNGSVAYGFRGAAC